MFERLPTIVLTLVLAVLGFAGSDASAEEEQPLDFLAPFVGVWVPHPDWEPRRPHPRMETLVPLNLQWQAGRSALIIEEGLRSGGAYMTSGIVIWNPVTSRADFLATQAEDNLIFDGYYESLDPRTVRRIYDVIDTGGGVRVFRETMHLRPDGGLDWTTEQQVEGVFRNVRGVSGPEFHAIRPGSTPGSALEDFAVLVGEWRPDPKRIPADMSAWRKRNGINDGYVSFSWGTGHRWIEFGEHHREAGIWRREGSGLIAWDPRSRRVVYREHTDSGITLDGSLERIDPWTIKRHYRAAHPDGSVAAWEDTWRWETDDRDCFEWTTKRLAGASQDVRQPYWVCRRSASEAAPGN